MSWGRAETGRSHEPAVDGRIAYQGYWVKVKVISVSVNVHLCGVWKTVSLLVLLLLLKNSLIVITAAVIDATPLIGISPPHGQQTDGHKSLGVYQPDKVHLSSPWHDLWPLTLKTVWATPTHVVNVCGNFRWNPSTKYRDIVWHEIYATDGRTDAKLNTSCCHCWHHYTRFIVHLLQL